MIPHYKIDRLKKISERRQPSTPAPASAPEDDDYLDDSYLSLDYAEDNRWVSGIPDF